MKVGKKIFVFLGEPGSPTLTVKLPDSAEPALMLECASPCGYGLGKWGWVTIRMDAADCPPVDVLADWLDESYRAIAPKRLVKELDATDQAQCSPRIPDLRCCRTSGPGSSQTPQRSSASRDRYCRPDLITASNAAVSPVRRISSTGGRFHNQASRSRAVPVISNDGFAGGDQDQHRLGGVGLARVRARAAPMPDLHQPARAGVGGGQAAGRAVECRRGPRRCATEHPLDCFEHPVGGELGVELRDRADGELGVQPVDQRLVRLPPPDEPDALIGVEPRPHRDVVGRDVRARR